MDESGRIRNERVEQGDGEMDARGAQLNVRSVVLGLLASLVVIVVIVSLVGASSVVAAFKAARPSAIFAIVVAVACWQVAWSSALHVVLSLLEYPQSRPRTMLIYLSIVFANSITPFAQAGAEPLAALFVSRATDAEYETGLSAVVSVDTINFLPSIGFAMLGFAYFTVRATLNPRLKLALVLFLVVALVVAVVAVFAWRSRETLAASLVSGLSRLGAFLSRKTPLNVDVPEQELERRVTLFLSNLEQIARTPHRLAVGLFFSAVGWFFLAVCLWLSLYSLGYAIPVEAPLFIVPLAMTASVTPLPGGFGGIDAAYILLLVSLTNVPLPVITAALLVFRAGTYLLPVIAGGAAVTMLEANRR
ncbi:flippase-like domain-containing protein [Haladaptatus sp. AB643]|uniref:lysylphosphatidylglycerol synthase transmembrane domain-containing protein n=1 Tax=unclassified Haladaptatus TaxID=2622732 RepID=UPI00209BEDD2|nr:flippase-like domain-containing protein [Haladaptatus sp. AB643]MCO8253842.1 flippase-like domain-containing protein [Haladaptatus sp. AB618]